MFAQCGYIFGQLYSKMYKNVLVDLSVSLKTFTHTQKDIQKTKIMTFGPITSWQIDGQTVETEADFFLYFLVWVVGVQNHCRWRLQP